MGSFEGFPPNKSHANGKHPEPPPGMFDDEPAPPPKPDLHVAPEAETHVVAASMASRECFASVAEVVGPTDFYDVKLALIFSACLESSTTDPVAVATQLRSHGQLDQVGGLDRLRAMTNAVAVLEPRPEEVRGLGEIVRARALERSAVSLVRTRAGELELANGTTFALVERLASELALLLAKSRPQNDAAPASPGDVIARWKAEGPYQHESTGMAELDRRTNGGLVYGKPTIVQGPPNAGKTLWLAEVADTLHVRGLAVGLLAIDEHADAIVTRLLQRRGWSREECEARDPEQLDLMASELATAGIFIYDGEYTVESAAADLAKRSNGRRALLCVDSLQTVECDIARSISVAGRETNLRLKIVENCKAIRKVAQEHRLLVVATSEMNRAAYKTKGEEDRPDDMTAGKESGSIEYVAGLLITLRSVKDEGELLEESLTKNKIGNHPDHRGPEDTIWLRLDRVRQRVSERDSGSGRPDAQSLHVGRVRGDAALVATALAEEPGLTDQELEDTLRARHAGFASKRRGPGLAILRSAGALVEMPGRRTSVRRYLDGSRVPPEVLALVPVTSRQMVATSRAPVSPNSDQD